MTDIQPFIEAVTSSENSNKRALVDKTIHKLVDLIDDASEFIIKYEGEDKLGMPSPYFDVGPRQVIMK